MRVNLVNNVTIITNNSLRMYVVMTDLKPYTKYQFQISASTRGGKAWSSVTIATTHQDSKLTLGTLAFNVAVDPKRSKQCYCCNFKTIK